MFHAEIARLPQNVANWVARLLETGLLNVIDGLLMIYAAYI